MNVVLIILLVLLLAGAWPTLGVAPAAWGYYPSGILGVVLLVVLILALTGRL